MRLRGRLSGRPRRGGRLDTVDQGAFDLLFYPGGHGPMEDLAYDRTSGALSAERLAERLVADVGATSPT